MPIYGTSGRTFLDIKQLQSVDYSFSSGSLTLKLNPTNLDYRSSTLTNGTSTNVVNATQVTTTISSGSTGGTTSGVASSILILAINNVGTTELAWTNALNPTVFDEQGLITTVAEGGAGAADSSSVVYSTTARTNVPYRIVGVFKSTQLTAGTWAQAPSVIHPAGGIPFVTPKTTRMNVDENVPAFSASRTTTQSITSSVFTKVQCQTEEYDYTGCYDNATNYRFQPNVAGIYRITLSVDTLSNAMTRGIVSVFKNGVEHKRSNDVVSNTAMIQGSVDVYFNGSSDYAEMYTYITATSPVIGLTSTYFQASLIRAG